ncbi:hypothetical protein PIROE2DRAFT_62560 [Piromyces sp. E2]|nr:hypothetical protein PIROE2DRAFT_62560 [Piromyces sp. E2]|eukprot:OUM61358.1 hypothetical protein PIROE2DRAFT_62560 [Piromyces sp. E2]
MPNNKEEWETYYSDEEDYVENMKNLNIKSNKGVKTKKGKKVPKSSINQHEIIEQYSESIIEEEHSFDESSITNYSIDYSMLSDMNDLSFLTNGQNLAAILNNTSMGNTLEDEINDAIDKEVLINPDTSLLAKTFFNSNEETDLSTLLPESVKGNYSVLTVEPTTPSEIKTETVSEGKSLEKVEEKSEEKSEEEKSKEEKSEEKSEEEKLENSKQSTGGVNTDSNPMFINRVSSVPIVHQSLQAIKSTTIGNFADKTLRRVASTRLPVISVPKLPSIPKIVGRNKDSEEEKKEVTESRHNSITIEDMTKNIPGLATMNTIGCKTLDKLEENFPMINDPKLLDKILNRIEELREIGENTTVVQSSLNSLQNVHNRLNRYNSVIIKRDQNKTVSKNDSAIKHRHSFSASTTKTESATTTIKNKDFVSTSIYKNTTTSTAKAAFETKGCCCCCKCHGQNNTSDQKVQQQQKKGIFSILSRSHNENSQEKPAKAKFFLRRSQKPIAFKEITSIRSNLQNNINSIPTAMYGHLSNVLTTIEKKLLNGTELGKEISANSTDHQNESSDNIKGKMIESDYSNYVLKDISKVSSEPSDIVTEPSTNSSLHTTITTTTTTSTSTTSTVTTTMTANASSQSVSSSLPPYQHYRMTSVSDSETESTVYNPSINSPLYTASSPLSMISTLPADDIQKPTLEMKDNDPSKINININGNGAHVHDLYSFLEEVNKLLTIYLVTRKKTDQKDQKVSIDSTTQY